MRVYGTVLIAIIIVLFTAAASDVQTRLTFVVPSDIPVGTGLPLFIQNPQNSTYTQTEFTSTVTAPGTAILIVTGVVPAALPPVVNMAPVVSAGTDLSVTLPAAASLAGSSSDDGLPSSVLTTLWSTISGPGTVTFGNSASSITTAAFSVAGSYTLRLTATDTVLSSFDDLVVTVSVVLPPPNVASVAFIPNNVQQGQTVTVTITGGTASRLDWAGIYTPSGGNTQYIDWKYLNNTKTAPSSAIRPATITFTAPTAGTYEFRLFANDTYTLITSSGLLTVVTSSGGVNTSTAASCSNGDIQSAINSASDGATIIVPAGNCSWNGDVTVPNTKGIKLAGSGTPILIMNGHKLYLQTSTGRSPLRVSGLRFRLTDTNWAIQITGTATNWRIDNNIFDENNIYGGYTIRVGSDNCNVDSFTYGVIDHNQFINRNYSTSIFVEWARGDTDPIACGDWIWSQPAELGTAQAVYVEDNVFSDFPAATASQVIDSRWGAKYVLRYNTIHNPWISTHSGCTNQGRDPIWTEVYKNVMTSDASRYFLAIELRSTSGIVWNNTIAPDPAAIGLDFERSWRSDCGGPYGGQVDGTRPWDENTPGQSGWRALGQPGWGPPQATNMNNATFAGLFAWQNVQLGAAADQALRKNAALQTTLVQFGRDIFNAANMTIGPIANRSTACSPGPANRSVYVSTDENTQGAKIYICSATDTWSKHWEPFTYPHPLTLQ